MLTVEELTCTCVGGDRPEARVVARGSSGALGLGLAQPLAGRSRDDVAACAAAVAAIAAALPLPISIATAVEATAELTAAVAPDAPAARFAIETAILDLVARATGRPLAAVLSPAPAPRVATNALVASVDDARAAVARGFHTLKLKVADDLALVRAIRAAVPPPIALRLDANLRWPAVEVGDRLAALAPLAIEYVEEPAPGYAKAAKRGPVPLALDESLADADRDAWLDRRLHVGAIAAIVLKPALLGLVPCLDLARRAHDAGVAAVVTHTFDGAVAVAAACELARAIGGGRAHGLAPHPGLAVAVPQLVADGWACDAGSAGLGLDRAHAGWA